MEEHDTKLSEEVVTSEARATLEEVLDRLNGQANKNLMKSNKSNILHL